MHIAYLSFGCVKSTPLQGNAGCTVKLTFPSLPLTWQSDSVVLTFFRHDSFQVASMHGDDLAAVVVMLRTVELLEEQFLQRAAQAGNMR